jgi:hypothetical protein
LKGLFYIISKQLVCKKLSSKFFYWKSKIEYLRFQKINSKILKYSIKKQTFSLILLEKIVKKIDIHKLYWSNLFFEKLSLFTKLKNTLRQYGYSYRKIPDLLIHDEENKSLVLLIRETYIKLFRLMKIKLLLSRKRHLPFFDKHKVLVIPDFFKLNNTFLKWKKYTIFCILRPHKITLAINNFMNLFKNKDLKIYLDCFRRIKKIPQSNYSDKISSDKESLIYVIKKVNIQIK